MKGNTGARCDVVRLVDRGDCEGAEGPEGVGAYGGLTAILAPRDSNATRKGEC